MPHEYQITTQDGKVYTVTANDDGQAARIGDFIKQQVAAGNPDLQGVDLPDNALLAKPKVITKTAAPLDQPAGDGGKRFLDTGVGWAAQHLLKGATALPGLLLDQAASEPGATRAAIDELLTGKLGMRADRPGDDGRMDRVLGAGMEGLGGVMSMGAMGAGADMAGGKTVANILRAEPTVQATGGVLGGVGGQTVAENGGDLKSQILASVLLGGLPGLAKTGAGAAVKGVMRGSDPTNVRNALDTFAAAGETPTVGQALGGRPAEIESFLSQLFGSSRGVIKRYQQQETNIGDTLMQKADELYPAMSNEDIGAYIHSNAEEGFKPQGRSIVDRQFDLLNKKLPSDTRVDMGPFQDYVAQKASINPTAPNLTMNPAVGGGSPAAWATVAADLKKDLESNLAKTGTGGMELEAVKQIRSNIGRMIENAAFDQAGGDIGSLRGAYGVLSESMKDAAEKAGSLDQFNKAMKTADWYHDILETVKPVIDKNGGFEKVFTSSLSGMKDGGTVLRNVYSTLSPDARQAVTSQILRRAAKPAAGDPEAFDMFRFAKNYRNMDGEAKKVVFDPKVVGEDFRGNMDKITDAIGKIEQMREKYGAASTPAQGRLGAQMILSSLLSTPVGLLSGALAGDTRLGAGIGAAYAGVAGGSVLTARKVSNWFTNPKTVKWLAETTKLPKEQIPIAINNLAQEAERQKDPEMLELAKYLQQQQQQEGGE